MADRAKGHENPGLVKLSAYERRQSEHVHYQPIGVRARARQGRAAKRHNGLKPMRFVSLHHHSTFSFLDGFQMPEAHVRRATEINMGAMAMTEHGNMFSHTKLEMAATAAGVKPIYGCELYMGWTDDRRTQRKNHLTVLAKNAEGYQNLIELVSRSWREGFYYEPTVDWRWLVEHQRGLIVLSGCQGSALFTAMVGGKHVPEDEAGYRRGLSVARWMARRLDDFYIEVQAFPELAATRRANPLLARAARAIGNPLVATMDCHYTAPEEAELQAVLHNIRPGEQRTLESQMQDWGYDVPLCPPPTDRAIYRRLRATGLTADEAAEAIVSTEEIAQECDAVLPRLPSVRFPCDDSKTEWRKWLKKGWRYRGIDRLPPAERRRYRERLQHEMAVIEDKGDPYINLFLITSDAVRFAKNEQIPVGPARGSAAGSLCCYLLRITEVDPVKYPMLVFERFIDVSRSDMPDIDLDFATYGRPIVRDYLVERYGIESVSNIGTFTYFKPKLSLTDTGRVHKIPKGKVELVKELLLERSSGDLRASATIEDTVDQFDEVKTIFGDYPELQHSMDLEGNVKGFGVHACGLVVSNGPITGVVPVLDREIPPGSGNWVQVIGVDKYDCERRGLEKLDFLSLSTMDMIAEALRQLDMKVEDLYSLSLEDEAVIGGFRANDVTGIFQFEGRATRTVNNALKPDNFDEIIYVNALSRPGPLHNGAAFSYIAVKHGQAEVERLHPVYDNIVEATKGQIIFQEQILRLVRDVGGFDWTSAAYIRRIISRKLGDQEFNRQKQQFLDGAKAIEERFPEAGPVSAELAETIWGMCITAGSYAFNAAHSVSYATLAYWTMWLKVHHPAVFYAASLAKSRPGNAGGLSGYSEDRHAQLRRDAYRHGIAVLPPDQRAGISWRAEGDQTLVAGWSNIPGIGAKKGEAIAEYVAEGGDDITEVKGIGDKTKDKIDQFCQAEDPFEILKLDRLIGSVREAIGSGDLELPEPSHTAVEALAYVGQGTVTWLGVPIYRNLRDIFEANRARTGEALDPDTVKRPDLSEWLIMRAEDEDELVSLTFSRFVYPRFKEAVWKTRLGEDVILIEGRKGKMRGTFARGAEALIFVDRYWVISPDA